MCSAGTAVLTRSRVSVQVTVFHERSSRHGVFQSSRTIDIQLTVREPALARLLLEPFETERIPFFEFSQTAT